MRSHPYSQWSVFVSQSAALGRRLQEKTEVLMLGAYVEDKGKGLGDRQ